MRLPSLPTIAALACALLAASADRPSPAAAERPSAVSGESDAERRAAALGVLFARLGQAKNQAEADPIVMEIWQLWARSGDDDIDLLMRRAGGNMQIGRLAEALAVLDDVVARAPGFAEGWNRRATVLYLLGEHARSLADCERVLALEPRHFGALAGMGMIAVAEGRWKAALDAYRRAQAVNPFLMERHELIPALERKVEGEPL